MYLGCANSMTLYLADVAGRSQQVEVVDSDNLMRIYVKRADAEDVNQKNADYMSGLKMCMDLMRMN